MNKNKTQLIKNIGIASIGAIIISYLFGVIMTRFEFNTSNWLIYNENTQISDRVFGQIFYMLINGLLFFILVQILQEIDKNDSK